MRTINLNVSDSWSNCIRIALEKADRMATLHNTPCHLVEGSKLAAYKVKLDCFIRTGDNILETINPPSKRNLA